MKKQFEIWTLSSLVLAVLIWFGICLAGDDAPKEQHPEVDFEISCMECHQEVTPDIYEAWKSTSHGRMNFGCYMCHGDGVEEFTAKPATTRCTACHSNRQVCAGKEKDAGCFNCHRGHELRAETKSE